MTAAQVAKACDLIDSLGETPSVRAVCRVLSAAGGKAASWAMVSAVVKRWHRGEFIEPATPQQHPGTHQQHFNEGAATASNTSADTRAAKEESNLVLLPAVVDAPPAVPPRPSGPKQPRQIGLGIGRDETIAASQLCGMLWKLIQPDMHAITQTAWRKRQMNAARDMVRAGVTLEAFEAGAEAFKGRRGYYPKQVSWLQEFMDKNPGSSGARVDSCGCPLPAGVSMPKLQPNETAHWDGDEFIFGDVRDPKARTQ